MSGYSFDLILGSGAQHLEHARISQPGATHDESAAYLDRVLDAFHKDPDSVDTARRDWAQNWLQKVHTGEYQRTETFERLEQDLHNICGCTEEQLFIGSPQEPPAPVTETIADGAITDGTITDGTITDGTISEETASFTMEMY